MRDQDIPECTHPLLEAHLTWPRDATRDGVRHRGVKMETFRSPGSIVALVGSSPTVSTTYWSIKQGAGPQRSGSSSGPLVHDPMPFLELRLCLGVTRWEQDTPGEAQSLPQVQRLLTLTSSCLNLTQGSEVLGLTQPRVIGADMLERYSGVP